MLFFSSVWMAFLAAVSVCAWAVGARGRVSSRVLRMMRAFMRTSGGTGMRMRADRSSVPVRAVRCVRGCRSGSGVAFPGS
ncbi:hypothetical protein GCM10017784_34570 [Deinococcus indicus]|nr:hypothetical protein GCM10017784_34570 [Deinococcus indicus]